MIKNKIYLHDIEINNFIKYFKHISTSDELSNNLKSHENFINKNVKLEINEDSMIPIPSKVYFRNQKSNIQELITKKFLGENYTFITDYSLNTVNRNIDNQIRLYCEGLYRLTYELLFNLSEIKRKSQKIIFKIPTECESSLILNPIYKKEEPIVETKEFLNILNSEKFFDTISKNFNDIIDYQYISSTNNYTQYTIKDYLQMLNNSINMDTISLNEFIDNPYIKIINRIIIDGKLYLKNDNNNGVELYNETSFAEKKIDTYLREAFNNIKNAKPSISQNDIKNLINKYIAIVNDAGELGRFQDLINDANVSYNHIYTKYDGILFPEKGITQSEQMTYKNKLATMQKFLSVSNNIKNFSNKVKKETLPNNPIVYNNDIIINKNKENFVSHTKIFNNLFTEFYFAITLSDNNLIEDEQKINNLLENYNHWYQSKLNLFDQEKINPDAINNKYYKLYFTIVDKSDNVNDNDSNNYLFGKMLRKKIQAKIDAENNKSNIKDWR